MLVRPLQQLVHRLNLVGNGGFQFVVARTCLHLVQARLHLLQARQRAVQVGLEHIDLVLSHLQLVPVPPYQECRCQQSQGQQGRQQHGPSQSGFVLQLVQLSQLHIIFLLDATQAVIQSIDGQ